MAEITAKPCPFCGRDLTKYPQDWLFSHATSAEFVKWLREHKKLVGSDNDVTVRCPGCGAIGPHSVNRECAVIEWNRRDGKDDASNVHHWIPCSERIPEPDTYVLALLRDGEMCTVRLYDDGCWIGCRGFAPSEAVTHWMPLPEPPKGGDNVENA